MKKIVTALMLGALTLGSVGAAQAAVNARQLNQQRRIDAGTRSGKLSPREAASLKAEQRSISNQEARMRARHHGHLTARDKQIIHARQERANHDILAKKHNARRGKNHLKL